MSRGRLAALAASLMALPWLAHGFDRPADTQALDRLNRSSQQALIQLQRDGSTDAQRESPGTAPAAAGTTMVDREQFTRQLTLQQAQRRQLLRQHYRARMSSQPGWQQRQRSIGRQRGFQRQQQGQLRRFGHQR